MAREGLPVATLIASGQIDKLSRSIDAARLFPDYSKLYTARMPDISKIVMGGLPDASKLALGSLPDVSKIAMASVPNLSKIASSSMQESMSKLASSMVGDPSKLLKALDAANVMRGTPAMADLSKLASSIVVGKAFPDYSKLFSAVDNRALSREYEAALPAATQAAEAHVIEEVLPEVEPYIPGQEVWVWVKSLPPDKQHQLAQKIAATVGIIVGLAGLAMAQPYLQLAGGLLALASALYAIYLVVRDAREATKN